MRDGLKLWRGTITLAAASTIDGHQPLTLSAGAGDIQIYGSLGSATPLAALTIVGANNITVQDITADSINQQSAGGTSTLLGALTTSTPAGITLVGNMFAIGPMATNITTTNGGPFVLTNSGLATGAAPMVASIDGAFIQNGVGPTAIGGTITTNHGGISFTGPTIVGVSTTMDSSASSSPISFGNILNGNTGTEDLTLLSGTGPITFSQTIGLTPLHSLTATGGTITVSNIGSSIQPGVLGSLVMNSLDGILFNGTLYNANQESFNAQTACSINSGALTTFNSNGHPLAFQTAGIQLSATTDLTLTTGGGNLSLPSIDATSQSLRHLILDSGNGTLQVNGIGTSGNGEFASATLTAASLTLGNVFANSISFNTIGTLTATGNIVSQDTALNFPSAVVVQGINTFSTVGTVGADLTFASTVDGAMADSFGLTLNTGGGNIVFANNVGHVARLASLTVAAANNVTVNPAATLVVDSFFQLNGFGTTTFNGPVIVPTAVGLLLSGNNFSFNNLIETQNNGPLTVTNSGTLSLAGVANLSGAFTQRGVGSVRLSGSVTAAQPILISSPIQVTGTPILDTSAASQTISLLSTVDGPGGITFALGNSDLVVSGNTGSTTPLAAITVSSSHNITVQSVVAGSLDLVSSTATAILNGSLSTTSPAGISLTGNNFLLNGALVTTGGGNVVVTNSGLITGLSISSRTVDGSYTQNGTGPVNFAGSLTTLNGPISFSSPLTLLASSLFDSSASNQDINFMGAIDGPGGLSTAAGTGNIIFTKDVGLSIPLGAVSIPSGNVTFQGDLDVFSLIQSAGSGTFDGNLTTAGPSGINLTGSQFTRGGDWVTTGSGSIQVNNSGPFTSSATGSIVSNGSFCPEWFGTRVIEWIIIDE